MNCTAQKNLTLLDEKLASHNASLKRSKFLNHKQ